MHSALNSLAKLGYFFMGVVQFAAIWSLGSAHWGWHWLLAGLAALVLSYIPLVGSICGMAGAVMVWNWPWPLALVLFFWWPVLFIVLSLLGIGASLLTLRRFRRQAETFSRRDRETTSEHRTIYMDDDSDDHRS